MVYSAYSFYKICIPLHCSWSDKKRQLHLCLQRGFWVLISVIFPSVQKFSILTLENKNLFQILG